MMLLIAHRGLVDGPNPSLENLPKQIEQSVSQGYDCEVDLWEFSGKLYLGHDKPQYEIQQNLLESNKDKLWIHAKNINALYWLLRTDFNYFWHESDAFTLTSKKYIWTYPNNKLTDYSICVMPEQFMVLDECLNLNCYAICTDYTNELKRKINHD